MFEDFIRTLLWGITSAVLKIGDAMFSISLDVAGLDISKFPELWTMWSVLITLVSGLVLVRVAMITIKLLLDTDEAAKFDIGKVLFRVMIIVLVMGLAPLMIRGATSFGVGLVENIGYVVGTSQDTVPSTVVISAINGAIYVTEDEEVIQKDYKLADIDINLEESGSYVYFPELGDIFVMLIVAALSSVGFILNAIEIAKRMFSLGMKILVSPIPISDLVNPDGGSFGMWAKMIISDIMGNYVQMLLLFFVVIVSTSQMVRDAGMWVVVIVLIGGVLTVLNGVPQIARLIGDDSSAGNTLQQIASIRQATSGVGRGAAKLGKGTAKLGGKAVGSAASLAGAGATYAAGRALGGNSMNQINSSNSSNSSNSNTNNQNSDESSFKSGGQDHRGDSRNSSYNSRGGSNNSSSNTSQNNQKNNNNNATNKGGDSLNQTSTHNDRSENRMGDTHEASNNSNVSFHDVHSQQQNNANVDGNNRGNQNMDSGRSSRFEGGAQNNRGSNPDRESGNKQGTSEKFGSQNAEHSKRDRRNTRGSQNDSKNPGKSFSREGSFASKVSQTAQTRSGITGGLARISSSGGRHAYQASMNRIQSSVPHRALSGARKLLKVPQSSTEKKEG